MIRPALVALLGGSLLAGCAVRQPTGPTVLAVPPEGKNLAQFQQEEANCRNYAFSQIGISPAQGANQAAAHPRYADHLESGYRPIHVYSHAASPGNCQN